MTQVFRIYPWDSISLRNENKPKSRVHLRGLRKIPFEDCKKLREDVNNGESIVSVAKKYDISYTYACMIAAGDVRIRV